MHDNANGRQPINAGSRPTITIIATVQLIPVNDPSLRHTTNHQWLQCWGYTTISGIM